MGLGQYTEALTENEIDLEAVQLMADSDFQDVGTFCVFCDTAAAGAAGWYI